MESLVVWYTQSLGHFVPKEVFVFIVSMLPVVELRGGLLIASLLKIPLIKANIICIIGNIIPMPFALLCLKKLLEFMKNHNILAGLVRMLERRAEKKSSGVEKGEFVFLLLFVGIPLPGTGGWTGSLIASLLEFDIKKAMVAILLGIMMAAIIMDIVSYGALGMLLG